MTQSISIQTFQLFKYAVVWVNPLVSEIGHRGFVLLAERDWGTHYSPACGKQMPEELVVLPGFPRQQQGVSPFLQSLFPFHLPKKKELGHNMVCRGRQQTGVNYTLFYCTLVAFVLYVRLSLSSYSAISSTGNVSHTLVYLYADLYEEYKGVVIRAFNQIK